MTKQLLQLVRESIADSSDLARFVDAFGFAAAERVVGRPPIVDAIGLVDSCLRESRPLDHKFSVAELVKLRNSLIVELARVLDKYGENGESVAVPGDARDQPGADKRRIAPYFRAFVRSLQPVDRTQRILKGPYDVVITTNYDTNVDIALYELVYDLDYPFLTDVFLGADFKDPYTDEPAFSEPEYAVDLYKLHGSLNWLYCPRCSRIYVAAFGQTVEYLAARINNSDRRCDCGYYSLEAVIIAPSVVQDITNPHLQYIWLRAYQALEGADEWIFAGYSLPAEDLAIRSLLYRALGGMYKRNRKRPLIKVVVPSADVDSLSTEYNAFFGGMTIEYVSQGFEEYVETLASVEAS